ncbi:MAG TPA: glycosyl hydrolase family 8 [Kofleriaceae bacterium]|nr:glycosyl hydrolase family 8 [Kofleriaceae bacterium]
MRTLVGSASRSIVFAAAIAGAASSGCGGASSSDPPDAASASVDATPADAPPGQTAPHPFGTHGGYVKPGVIFPNDHTPQELDDATASFYDAWKAKYLVPGCTAGEYRVKSTPATDAYTVSEAHGYGMLIAVIMDGHDPDARAIFDGLFRYYDAHRSATDAGLMAWAQDQGCADVMGADSATDGDLDIAYALLLADREWGSSGAIDYRAAAARIMDAILASEIHPSGSILVGDWAGAGDAHYTGTRSSDFMIAHFRTFGIATGESRWFDVEEHAYALVASLQATYAPKTGLLPDFAINATGVAPAPAPADWLEGADDGRYAYNACRVPWRIATDYLMWGDVRARNAVRPIEKWLRAKTGDTPTLIRDGYGLDGMTYGHTPELAFVAPIAVAAMIEPATGTNQPWLNALWDELAARPTGEYYGDTLKLLAMIVISGNWWMP